MIDPKEYDDLIYSIYAQVENQIYDTVSWATDHLEFENDDDVNEMHSYVLAAVIEMLYKGPI